jgi:transposase-like protein
VGSTASQVSETLRKHRQGKISPSWYVDETYIKVKGRWTYLYCAIDRDGNLVDVLLSEKRDRAAAEAFFQSVRTVTGRVPERVTSDGHDAYPGAIKAALLEIVFTQMTKPGLLALGMGREDRANFDLAVRSQHLSNHQLH